MLAEPGEPRWDEALISAHDHIARVFPGSPWVGMVIEGEAETFLDVSEFKWMLQVVRYFAPALHHVFPLPETVDADINALNTKEPYTPA
jgi:hypothetical protein